MKNIIIAGGGFAGISAAKQLCRGGAPGGFRIVLVDKKDNFEFLPMLPDIIGGWCRPGSVSCCLRAFSAKSGCEFVKDEIIGMDPGKRTLKLKNGALDYEYLLISSGSGTNFFGNAAAEQHCFKLDEVNDGLKIKTGLINRFQEGPGGNVVIVGGGYTGVEIASNARLLLKKTNREPSIFIIEKTGSIMSMVPEWVRRETEKELEKLRIEIITGDSLEAYDGQRALLGSGREIGNSFCVWSAGVKTPGYIQDGPLKKQNGRIMVDESLACSAEGVFAAGDAACFPGSASSRPLRMAVMFSIAEGKTAAANIAYAIRKKPRVKYRPLDLGFLVPMAHGRAAGFVLGLKARGMPGYLMHYAMCVYRSEAENRARVMKDLMSRYRTGI